MREAGAALGIGPAGGPAFDELLVAALGQLMRAEVIDRLTLASAGLCDGGGTVRVAQVLESSTWV